MPRAAFRRLAPQERDILVSALVSASAGRRLRGLLDRQSDREVVGHVGRRYRLARLCLRRLVRVLELVEVEPLRRLADLNVVQVRVLSALAGAPPE